MGKYVVCTKAGATTVYLTEAGRWTPDIHGARQFRFGVDTFMAPGKVWIDFAPRP